jgi:tRNA dimethylallyltransferase
MALLLARSLNAEIVNADSRQVYRHMDIGTAKPTSGERSSIPHHLLDVADPDERYSLGLYQRQAQHSISEIVNRGRLPLLVGGTGLYMWAVVEGWRVPAVPPDTTLRQELEELSRRDGVGALFRRLHDMDPDAAEVVDHRNPRRLVRAIEVRLRGGPPSLRYRDTPPYTFRVIGLTMPRPQLYQHIDSRVDRMIEKGLVAEVEGLLRREYSLSLPALSGAGYREIGLHLEGKVSLEEAIQQTKYHTHRIARHQYAWFRTRDPRIHWLDINECPATAALRLTEEWLSEIH